MKTIITHHVDILSVGRGFSRIGQADALHNLGLSIKVVEALQDAGKTWLTDTYPERRAMLRVSRIVSPGRRRYLEDFVCRHGHHKDVNFNTELVSANGDETTKQAFERAGLIASRSLTLLQPTVLYLTCLPQTRFAWTMHSVVIRLALGLGLHRDVSTFGLTTFEAEMRRHLWWYICILGIETAEI
ncbi:hypothetical protein BBP40_004078 [Aspergillus hancockii]|nr:hypothetical protein BBP40_004078 [Aspergillus hancockii]